MALALATAPAPQPTTPNAAASAFVDAFRAMDQARFDDFFASDVTMFFPDGAFPVGRVEGREAVLSAFHSFFARVKERGRTTLNITPLDQRVDQYGDVAVVTFWLDSGGAVGRRSVILRKIQDDWRIAHFHASTVEK
jgi:ketosteroid isomerase-like protein